MHHIPPALIAQLLVSFISGDLYLGAAVSAGFYVGREVAQAEYRWIAQFGGGLRSAMPWHAGFTDPRSWTRKSVIDFTAPAVACFVVAILGELL